MTSSHTFTYDGDIYEVEVNNGTLLAVWCHRSNNGWRPEFVSYTHLDDEGLKDQIDNIVIRSLE